MQQDEIIVKNVSHKFTLPDQVVPVLDSLNFSLKKGTFTIVFGPSGSGKSTLLNILTGMLKPSDGSLIYRDVDLYSLTSEQVSGFRSKTLGRVYQTSYWVKSLNCVENVALPLFFQGYRRADAIKQARDSLSQLGMQSYEKKYPTRLSGGEQQRVAISRALVSDPALIVADEPTGNLDLKNSDMVIDLLKRCRQQLNKTVVLVTHDLRYLPSADQLLEIADGKINNVTGRSIDELTKSLTHVRKEGNEQAATA